MPVYKAKVGRPKGVSDKVLIKYNSKKEYMRAYDSYYSYIFTVKLSNEKDNDIIEVLEQAPKGKKQTLLKKLLRIGIKHLSDVDNFI